MLSKRSRNIWPDVVFECLMFHGRMRNSRQKAEFKAVFIFCIRLYPSIHGSSWFMIIRSMVSLGSPGSSEVGGPTSQQRLSERRFPGTIMVSWGGWDLHQPLAFGFWLIGKKPRMVGKLGVNGRNMDRYVQLNDKWCHLMLYFCLMPTAYVSSSTFTEQPKLGVQW